MAGRPKHERKRSVTGAYRRPEGKQILFGSTGSLHAAQNEWVEQQTKDLRDIDAPVLAALLENVGDIFRGLAEGYNPQGTALTQPALTYVRQRVGLALRKMQLYRQDIEAELEKPEVREAMQQLLRRWHHVLALNRGAPVPFIWFPTIVEQILGGRLRAAAKAIVDIYRDACQKAGAFSAYSCWTRDLLQMASANDVDVSDEFEAFTREEERAREQEEQQRAQEESKQRARKRLRQQEEIEEEEEHQQPPTKRRRTKEPQQEEDDNGQGQEDEEDHHGIRSGWH